MEIVLLRGALDDLFESYEQHGELLHSKINETLELLKDRPELGAPYKFTEEKLF